MSVVPLAPPQTFGPVAGPVSFQLHQAPPSFQHHYCPYSHLGLLSPEFCLVHRIPWLGLGPAATPCPSILQASPWSPAFLTLPRSSASDINPTAEVSTMDLYPSTIIITSSILPPPSAPSVSLPAVRFSPLDCWHCHIFFSFGLLYLPSQP